MAGENRQEIQREETRQLRQYNAVGFDGGSAVDLAAQMQTWFESAGEKVKLEIHIDGTKAIILYTE